MAGGNYGDLGDGGPAVDAELANPSAVAVDGGGNLYIADTDNFKIRKVDASTREISTVAGDGNYGYAGDGVSPLSAQLRSPTGVAVDVYGHLYIADKYNNRIRKVAGGIISTIAGTGENDYWGDNGPADTAKLSGPGGVTVDVYGNLYIADTSNHRIRKVDATGTITTVAGSDDSGFAGDGGPAVDARLYYPNAVAIDGAGNLFIADTYNNRIRKVDASTRKISTVAGSSGVDGYSGDGGPAINAKLNEPEGIAVDNSGNLYIADTDNNRIRKVLPNGNIITIAGTGVSGYLGDGGVGNLAQLNGPTGLAVDSSGNLYIADKYNYAIRKQVTYIPSSDAGLSNITLSSGTLSPAFASSKTDYTASVVNGVSSIRVTPTTADSLITVKVNGQSVASGAQSEDINLDVGDNTVTLVALAEDGETTKTYTITIERLRSSNANLSQLTLSNGTLSPAFASNTTSYSANANQSAITVTPTMADPMATVKVNGATVTNGTASQSIPLNVGNTAITVVVTAQDGITTKTYILTVMRSISANADLSGLSLSAGTLSPAFEADTTSYTANVGNSISSVTVTPTTADGSAAVTVNGVPVDSGVASASLPLIVGSNTISMEVTAENGTTKKTYTVTVTRAKSSNADLSDLSLSNGVLTPSFVPGTFKTNVDYQVSSVTIMPTVSDTIHAAVTVSLYNSSGTLISGPYTVASGTASPLLPLAVGNNTITIVVTAEDGTAKTYTVAVTRGASSNADLSNLTLSSGPLIPAFAGTYTANVGYSVSSVTVTPTLSAADSASVTASVYDGSGTRVSGPHPVASGAASPSLPLNVGDNVILLVVTAQDGTARTYTVTVTRAAASGNADLSGLTLSNGSLSPAFEPERTSYTASVGNSVQNVTVTMEMSDAGKVTTTASVYTSAGTLINGPFVMSSGTAAFSFQLNVGSNEILILIRTQDDTTKTYTINVTRAVGSNADLSDLSLSNGVLTPSFVPGTYTANVGYSVSSVTITPTISDTIHAAVTVSLYNSSGALISGPYTVTSGTASPLLPLAVGNNTMTIVVTAEDGTAKTYTVAVTRGASSNAELSNLTLSSGSLIPAFAGTYTANVEHSVSSVTVTPTLSAADSASVTASVYDGSGTRVSGPHVLASAAASPSLPLAVGNNVISILVTAEDGSTRTYTVTVTRAASSNADLSGLTLSSGPLSPAFEPERISYSASVGNNVSSMTVTPAVADDNAAVTVNGVPVASGVASASLLLNVGSNEITILVTAQDDTTKTYKLVITRVAPNPAPSSSYSGGGGGSAPIVNNPVIDLNGQKLDLTEINTERPFVTLEATPTDGVVIVVVPASILTELAAKNADFYLEIKTPYGSYQVPANLALLIPELPDLLAKNELQAGDASFRITLTDKSSDKNMQVAIANAWPNGKVLGPVVDFRIDIVNAKSGLTIGTADKFNQALTRWIPLSNNATGLPKLWGAFRYHEATKKFEFVPARKLKQDGVWYAAIRSYTNSVYVALANTASFADVEQHWSKASIEFAAAKGLVEGIGEGQFDPDKIVTRAEFTVMLVRSLRRGYFAAGSTGYADVKSGVWYSDVVAQAQELGLLDFVSGERFNPDQPLTRMEMASMLAAAIHLDHLPVTTESVSLDNYKDMESVEADYLKDIRLMIKLQIMTGTAEDTFSPQGQATRAQAVTVLIRTLQALGMVD
ncbi:cadherin-like beta sandwich domain-containing protein [Paenibacillus thalictri]|uniref:cadherin-like beta sandwich domain-containing protein n=1 Tax=Paenibacillus thalictri TaxID=2527873 RepID=UPI0013EF1D8F|nr:cadherin-like beta sandwich domain-containing protein [Paenibacillus thalictri]